SLSAKQDQIESRVAEARDLYEELDRKYHEALAAQAAAAPAGSGGTTKGGGSPIPPPPAPNANVAAVLQAAYSVIGTPYQYGGSSPETGFDCSGFTMWAWSHAGVYLPHSSAAQYASLPHVAQSDLQPGDLVFFYSPISHVGMYVGGGSMIHSPQTGSVVSVGPLYWGSFVGALRRPPPPGRMGPSASDRPMTDTSPRAATEQDLALVEALRAGDETAFMMLVERYQPAMLRIALMYVSTRAVAEDVVQDAWVGVLKGLDRFEGRSSLRTWIFRILVNTAKTRGQREARSVPFSSVWAADPEVEPSVDPDRVASPGHPSSPGRWAEPPAGWASTPEERLLSKETLAEGWPRAAG